MRDFYVYIVRCSDGSLYTGVTNDYANRVVQHNEGLDPKSYTFRRRPVALVYVVHFDDVYEAIAWEKVLKKWNRKKKEAVIAGEWERLPELSLCLNGSHSKHYQLLHCHIERSRNAIMQLGVVPRLRSG